MKRTPPPLRFLLLVVGGWMCVRTAVYAPGWWVGKGVAGPVSVVTPGRTDPAPMSGEGGLQEAATRDTPPSAARVKMAVPFGRAQAIRPNAFPRMPGTSSGSPPAPPALASLQGAAAPMTQSMPAPVLPPLPSQPVAAPTPDRHGRWSGSAWLLLRPDGGPALAQGGTLGGSQAGARIGYLLNRGGARPLSIAARLSAPAGDRRAAEAALGLEWRPIPRLPVRLAAERRQGLGSRGRSAFALGAHGGVSGARLPGGFRLDAYGQAGVVGARSRDLYADGAARVTLPAGRFDVGAGLSGGAQPGTARLDAGPVVALRVPAARLRVSAEWRFRIAGDARPGSGPALTIGTDF
jgi:hypothetical protein